jgi:CBS domain-containing protein
MRAIEAGRQPPPTVPAGTPLHEVARLLASEGLRAVVVTDREGGPAGIVTERDLVVRGLAWNLPSDTPVEAVMTPELVTASPSAPARFAYRLLRAHGIRQVPLVDAGRVVGIVDRDDLVDEARTEVLADLRRCPRCQGEWLRPVSTMDATNFLCLVCRSCWHLADGVFVQVETRSCPGCPEHNFCRFPLIDYGVDTARLPSPQPASAEPC